MAGTIYNPMRANLGDGTNQLNNLYGLQGEQLNADLHGKYFQANIRRGLYTFNVTAVTVPVVAATVTSVFTLWNPASSNTMAEIISTQQAQVLATTVVNSLGWYFSSGSTALAGTFATKATALTNYFSGRIGDTPSGLIQPYTSYTHSGTPTRIDIVDCYGAVTDAGPPYVTEKLHEGRLLLPPGVAISLLNSTAAGFTSGTDLQVTWAEYPFA